MKETCTQAPRPYQQKNNFLARTLFVGVMFFALFPGLNPANAQNVGIGTTTPINGKLEIVSGGNTLITRTSSSGSGISLFNPSGIAPTIGFNLMNPYNYLGAGYGSFLQYTPADGKLKYFSSAAAGAANTAVGTTTSTLLTLNPNGYLGIGSSDPTEGLHLSNRNIRLDDAAGNRAVMINPNGYQNAASIVLYEDGGNANISIRASDAANSSGEIIFTKPGVSGTMLELDGDYGLTGRSRIIVDEIQIKGGADFAEYFDLTENTITPEPGMLVCIDAVAEGKMAISEKAYDKKVAGVISGANGIDAGMMMGHKGTIADGKHPIAISGRVYVKAEAYKTAIKPGDLITTSNRPGYAMLASNEKKSRGAVIGKAMGTLKAGTSGYLLVLLTIQ